MIGSRASRRVIVAALAAALLSSPAAAGAAAKASKTTKGKRPMAVITMEKGGVIEIEFYPEVAPKTVDNFVKLANKGFYNGLTFHRVEPGFVVQGGDPDGNGMGGPGYTIKAEFSDRPHERGTLAMARSSDPDSAGSQFYICLAPAPFLDGKYTVFGKVTKGMDVVDKIRVGDKMKTVAIK
jgi:cyclophilin family peptidyl-prolyl cis-trans isomerase